MSSGAFPQEFWPRIVGDKLAKSTAPVHLRKRTLVIGVSGRERERVLREMEQLLVFKINEFRNLSPVRRLDLHVVDLGPGGNFV